MKVPISILENKTLKSITKKQYNACEYLVFETDAGEIFLMGNKEGSFGCDLGVVLEEVVGDFKDLIETPILLAEERSNKDQSPKIEWTFYEFRTIKGSVTLRWMSENYSAEYFTEVLLFKGKF